MEAMMWVKLWDLAIGCKISGFSSIFPHYFIAIPGKSNYDSQQKQKEYASIFQLTSSVVCGRFFKKVKLQKTRRTISAHETVWIIGSILNQPVNIQHTAFMNM